jgi:cytochrome c biogenesis protein ResB
MKVKLTLLSVLAIASIVVTLLALSAENISQAAPDRGAEQVDTESLPE